MRFLVSFAYCCGVLYGQGNVIPFLDCIDRTPPPFRGTSAVAQFAAAGSGQLALSQPVPPGSVLIVNAGGANQETVQLIANSEISPYFLTRALVHAHNAGEIVEFEAVMLPTAYFGYFNLLSTPVQFAAATDSNFIFPNAPNVGQPSTFLPGMHRRSVAVQFVPLRDVTWILDSGQAVARISEGPACDAPPPPAVSAENITVAPGVTTAGVRLGSTDPAASPMTASVLTTTFRNASSNGPRYSQDFSFSNLRVENGVILGDVTPGANATRRVYQYSVQVTSAGRGSNIASGTIEVVGACPMTVSPALLPVGSVGATYSATFQATGTPAPVSFSIEGMLPAGLSLSGGTLSGVPQQSGAFAFLLKSAGADGCFYKTAYTLQVAGAACATNVTAQVQLTLGGFRQNLVNRHWLQTVTIRNGGSSPIAGPIALVLDGLSANAALSNASGFTSCGAPLGSAYLLIDGGLAPGQTATASLDFTNSNTAAAITYTPRVVAGGSIR